jgi:hypothetical protein
MVEGCASNAVFDALKSKPALRPEAPVRARIGIDDHLKIASL